MKIICYLACGYPTIEKSLEMAEVYVQAGCDAIEWCLPPKDPYVDPPYIGAKLRQARRGCADYEVYLKELAAFRKKFPQVEIILLLYQETVLELTTERLITYCREHGIDTILSGNLSDETVRKELMGSGIKLAASINYTMYPEEFELACTANGFVYVQAMPSPEDLKAGRGRETLKMIIDKLREMGVDRPVYCGVGIRSPQDITFIRESGGQGFFLGSTIMQYYEKPEKLAETIRAYKEAGKDPI